MAELDPETAREKAVPKLYRSEMARKLGISDVYMFDLERGRRPWPDALKEKFFAIIRAWEKNPTPKERKKRTVVRAPRPRRRMAHTHASA